jgi:hypothetical protein
MEEKEYLDNIRKSAKRRAKARHEQRAATDELRVVCTQAKYAGLPITEIARWAELSRQGVYDLIGHEPPS